MKKGKVTSASDFTKKTDQKPKAPEYTIDVARFLYWCHTLWTGTNPLMRTPQLYANKIVTDCVRRDGKELTAQEASDLILNKNLN